MTLNTIYKILFISFVIILLSYSNPSKAFSASKLGQTYSFSGQSMSTFYTIKFISKNKESISLWEKKVNVRLNELNHKFSIFGQKGELQQFNTMRPFYQLKISKDFYTILITAQNLYEITDGAWDGTIKPLVDLWGFGTVKKNNSIPDPKAIRSAQDLIGFNSIHLFDKRFVKKNKALSLDLGSIAKGYGVDMIAAIFESAHIKNFLIEIGGELYASGKNAKGDLWSVGISNPVTSITHQKLFKIIQLKNQAIATSGNYRNYFKVDGQIYSHILDPKTGYPVTNKVVSASVISNTCTFSDGLATALMVMDIRKGLQLVNSLENTECLIIEKNEKGLVSHVSDQFKTLLKN